MNVGQLVYMVSVHKVRSMTRINSFIRSVLRYANQHLVRKNRSKAVIYSLAATMSHTFVVQFEIAIQFS